MASLKSALVAMQHRVGRVPTLWDFYRFESVDPVLLATKRDHYPALVRALLREESDLTPEASSWLRLISHEVLASKRLHETVLLQLLIERESVTAADVAATFADNGLPPSDLNVRTAVDSLALRGYSQGDARRYGSGIVRVSGDSVALAPAVITELRAGGAFAAAVKDVLETGSHLIADRYLSAVPFTPGMQYTRRDAARLVGWPRSTASTIYGYKTDVAVGVATIFVTLHKSENVEASTAYEDALLDQSSMRWFSKSNRTSTSKDVAPIAQGKVALHVFVKKDEAEGSDHYYLGRASVHDVIDTAMQNGAGEPLPVVQMTLRFDEPLKRGLFDYFGFADL